MSSAERRARALGVFVEEVKRHLVYERADGLCGICGHTVSKRHFEIDHIIPLSRGGTHQYSNVQPAHSFCNRRKAALMPEEYAALPAVAATHSGKRYKAPYRNRPHKS